MKHAFEKAGLNPVENDLALAISRYLNNGGEIERAYALLDAAAERLPGDGAKVETSKKDLMAIARPRQPNDEVEGQGWFARKGPMRDCPASSPDRGSEGQNIVAQTGHAACAPSREPTPPRTAAEKKRAVARAGSTAAAVHKGIFARQLGGPGRRIGELTKWDVAQAHRRSIIDNHIAARLLADIEWPDEEQTTLEQCATEDEVTAIFNSAYRVLDGVSSHG